jgi:integrase
MGQDRQYLQRKRGQFYAQIAVPSDLQKRLGRKVMVKYLGTASLSIAQTKRWEHVNAWKAAFKRARANGGLTSNEIEGLAQAERKRLASIMYLEPSGYHRELAVETNGDPVAMMLSEGITDTLRDLNDGDYRRVWKQLAEQCATTGTPLPPLPTAVGDEIAAHTLPDLSAAQTELAVSLMRAHVAAFEDALARRRGEAPPPIGALNVARTSIDDVPARYGKGIAISQAAREYVADKMRHAEERWTNQTKNQNEFAFRLFASLLGDCPIDAVTRKDALAFKDAYAKIKPTFGRSRNAKSLSFAAIMAKHTAEPGRGPAARSIERNIAHLLGLFKWAGARDLYDGRNPFEGITGRTVSEKRKGKRRTRWLPWTPDELSKLFHSPLLTSTSYQDRTRPKSHGMDTALMWLPLIALYSGMRQGEIAQCRVSDMRQEKVKLNGKSEVVHYFDVTEEGEGQSVKSDAATRKVPVHPMLVRCGFLDYLAHVKAQHHELLFPGLKPGGPDAKLNAAFVKTFTRHRRSIGVDNPDKRTERNRTTFHSLRHNWGTACEKVGTSQTDAARVMGHELNALTYGLYSEGLSLDRLKAVVEAVKYPELDLSHLYQPKKPPHATPSRK